MNVKNAEIRKFHMKYLCILNSIQEKNILATINSHYINLLVVQEILTVVFITRFSNCVFSSSL